MMKEEEITEDEGCEEVLKRLFKSTVEYLVTYDKEELKELMGKPAMNKRMMF